MRLSGEIRRAGAAAKRSEGLSEGREWKDVIDKLLETGICPASS
jgi:hypothetical protein